jgi:hypothetical protein
VETEPRGSTTSKLYGLQKKSWFDEPAEGYALSRYIN